MTVTWTPRALLRLSQVHRYIQKDSPDAADAIVQRIRDSSALLKSFPKIGRIGRVENTLELVVSGTPYILIYRLVGDGVEIATVLHGARQWPGNF